ncbi:hypothetical protein J6590_008666 [Homalodisca vitripennis]|nr:hypothetical protein J6590_008666 [Homalodisca vitripennis]
MIGLKAYLNFDCGRDLGESFGGIVARDNKHEKDNENQRAQMMLEFERIDNPYFASEELDKIREDSKFGDELQTSHVIGFRECWREVDCWRMLEWLESEGRHYGFTQRVGISCVLVGKKRSVGRSEKRMS